MRSCLPGEAFLHLLQRKILPALERRRLGRSEGSSAPEGRERRPRAPDQHRAGGEVFHRAQEMAHHVVVQNDGHRLTGKLPTPFSDQDRYKVTIDRARAASASSPITATVTRTISLRLFVPRRRDIGRLEVNFSIFPPLIFHRHSTTMVSRWKRWTATRNTSRSTTQTPRARTNTRRGVNQTKPAT